MTSKLVKKLIGIAAVAALALPLAACGNASTSQGASSGNSSTGNVRTINAVTGGTPAPFTFKDAQGNVSGQNIELTEAVFKKLPQYKLKWQTAEFSSLFSGLDAGRYQLAVNNFTKSKEREAKYLFSDPIYSNSYVAVVSKDSGIKKLDSLDDLAGKKVIVCASGCNIALALQKYNTANPDKASKLTYSQTEGIDAIRQVENGTGDVYLLDKPTFGYLKKKVGFDAESVDLGDEAQSTLAPDSYSYLVFPKGEEQLVKDVNKALKEVFKDGTSKQIDEKWFGSDQTPTNVG
ncbi:transporter substrate-binding domain-containing protein [Bifidobacterium sp. MA2]|uniref:Transporter substrate-binding domain-containing protein n=1 Tax=Bifidobacterium santillanense TaxID=2809028 RepID=A0ABS5UNF2_9BIFI|nr:transporter substrate-binding domain-containing protein [Bifidobacterium santillanense]MBT1172437.1 transporter substrate-binding domain-containing protein [Bifidobacterium santillanense]